MRSKMWESGRNDSIVSAGPMSMTSRQAATFDAMFACVSMAPLGSPVVPEV